MDGAFWWRRRFGGRDVLVEGVFWWRGCFDGGCVLVEGVFWWRVCFGGGGVLMEGAFWWRDNLVKKEKSNDSFIKQTLTYFTTMRINSDISTFPRYPLLRSCFRFLSILL